MIVSTCDQNIATKTCDKTWFLFVFGENLVSISLQLFGLFFVKYLISRLCIIFCGFNIFENIFV